VYDFLKRRKTMAIKIHPLHEKAVIVSQEYRKRETELVSLLREIEEKKIYALLGFSSMRHY
jgi:hypothetical protein